MKRIITLFLSLTLLALSATMLYGCGDRETPPSSNPSTVSSTQGGENNIPNEHEHIFAAEWTQAENGHYRECTCHPEYKSIAPHSDSVDRDGKCDVCQFVIKEATLFALTLKDNEGNPVVGAKVRLFTSSEDKILVTNSEGVVSYGFIYYDTVKAIVTESPKGYEDISSVIHRFDDVSLEITVSKSLS